MISSSIRKEDARRRVKDFESKFGKQTLRLAYHAAMAVVLNADLLHLLRINFFFDPPESLPSTAESDLLLSSLSHEVDDGLYEIDPDVRDVLLQRLAREPRYGQKRIREIATLLWQYNERYSPWIDRPLLERAQQLTALNLLDPKRAERWLEEAEYHPGLVGPERREWFVAMREEIGQRARALAWHFDLLTQSPYVINGPVPDRMFFGREQELRLITENATTRSSFAVIGGRRIGTTSVLARLYHTILPASACRTVYFDCSRANTRDAFLASAIEHWQPESPPNTLATFGDLLEFPPEDKPLILLIDESDALISSETAAGWPLFSQLRTFSANGKGQFVFGAGRLFQEAARDPTSPLFNFVREIRIGPLDYPAVEQLVMQPMAQLEIELVEREKIVRRIYDFTSGHPNIVQRLCHRLVQRLDEFNLRRITLADVEEVVVNSGFRMDDYLHVYWGRATSLEKMITILMATDGTQWSLPAIHQAVEQRCEARVELAHVADALKQLVRLEYILKQDQDVYTFAAVAFPSVIKSMATIEDMLVALAKEIRGSEIDLEQEKAAIRPLPESDLAESLPTSFDYAIDEEEIAGTGDVHVEWNSERSGWLQSKHGNYLEGYEQGQAVYIDYDSTAEPVGRLASQKILKLYGLPDGAVSIEDVSKTSPQELWSISRTKLRQPSSAVSVRQEVAAADALVHAQSCQEYARRGKRPDEHDWRAAIIAGAQLLKIGLAAINSQKGYSAVRARVASWLVALIETPRSLPLPERIEAGNTLGRLGDLRFLVSVEQDGISSYILPPFVHVEAGSFEMGSSKAEPLLYGSENWAKTQNKWHTVDVDEFEIGQYPVTNAEYQCFIRARGYAAPEHWRDGNVPSGLENHPVVNVSWHDAQAYCRWLSDVSGQVVRLPTEAEWEKAARWDKVKRTSRVYPWSDDWDRDRSNTWEAELRATTPVGIYPDGASPYGCLDMAGNVWEWCQSQYKAYPYRADDGRELLSSDAARVVRGGSWLAYQFLARCSYRQGYLPDARGDYLGFRVVSLGFRF